MQQAFPGVETSVQEYGTPGEHKIMVRVPLVGSESDGSLSRSREQITSALKQSSLGNFSIVGSEIVGPIVGEELTRKGIWATVLSMVAILLYIGLRFQISFGVGAIVATIHDLLVTLAFLAFFQYDLTLNVIAAILTITGYSTNDTIVIFDRVRENSRAMRRDGLNEIINRSINQTLGRTLITAGTALMSALALFLFGGEVLRGFAFTMVVGIITGTYSTDFHRRGDRELLARKPRTADRCGAGCRGSSAVGQVQAAESTRVVDRFSLRDASSCGAARNRTGNYRIPAGLVHGASAASR